MKWFVRAVAFAFLFLSMDRDYFFVGGIDWFRSQNSGASWDQITKWSNNNNLAALNCSLVHADQHGLYFRPGNNNQAIVVNDGGVAYCSNLQTASSTANFTENEGGMITTQFYRVAQSGTDFPGSDYVAGGTQDNGSYAIIASNNNQTAGTELTGGDGAVGYFFVYMGDTLFTATTEWVLAAMGTLNGQ